MTVEEYRDVIYRLEYVNTYLYGILKGLGGIGIPAEDPLVKREMGRWIGLQDKGRTLKEDIAFLFVGASALEAECQKAVTSGE